MEFEFKFKWIEYEYSEEQEDYIEKVVQENSSIVDKTMQKIYSRQSTNLKVAIIIGQLAAIGSVL